MQKAEQGEHHQPAQAQGKEQQRLRARPLRQPNLPAHENRHPHDKFEACDLQRFAANLWRRNGATPAMKQSEPEDPLEEEVTRDEEGQAPPRRGAGMDEADRGRDRTKGQEQRWADIRQSMKPGLVERLDRVWADGHG